MPAARPVLVVFAGLPGTGKTTLARQVALARRATLVRIDTIEQALRATSRRDVGVAGYVIAYALSAENLQLGRDVVADCVNPLEVTRSAWHDTAIQAGASIVEVEIVCSDAAEHRRRIETRVVDIPGLVQPGWNEVMGRDYAPWTRPRVVVDTAILDPAAAAALILAAISTIERAPV